MTGYGQRKGIHVSDAGEITRFLNQADVKERLFNAGMETVGSSPEQLAVTVKSEITRMSKVIKDAGIRSETVTK